MIELVLCLLVIAAALAFIYSRLAATNMHVGENVERPLRPREALRFALDEGLPLTLHFPRNGTPRDHG